MLQKWKTILTNWINCYFIESTTKEHNVSVESLITIISHLRENLNLDESKSSVLEAHTVEEFIIEKYPEFKFENNSAEPGSEEDVCVAASLLLLFVCVNSKDVDIKNAMCNKLSIEDQETILKFSKCLMECSPISYRDVQTAITEACGQDIATIETTNGRAMVAETPPALRSLHGEVRRLQAALDAERFDRNYLQEELARTNLKLEKLLKDKEQYKLDIVNLKAKISLCCGQEAESRAESCGEGTTKLMRQLQQMEEKLVETQGQLDDVQYERDTYKAKIDELKQERDKWLAYSQQETTRVGQLTEDLETERRHVNSLKELVSELRQHNQLNRLDTSQLECDDPDASLHSVHNSSVCSEVCANVVEVQLGEERAKIVVLKQQIQSLQEQINDLNRKSEDEKQSLQRVISERDNDIFNLKHRINEEIEEKNNIKAQFNDQVSRLNNEINELEQKLTDNMEQSRRAIEGKMQDIQTLQEEKLSLLQSLSNETTKLNNVISSLVSELDSEKSAKVSMRDDYENKIMKLNEKVLNRNNELVELQDKISAAGERLEELHADLRKEKQARQDDVEKHGRQLEQVKQEKTAIENILQQNTQEVEELYRQLRESSQHKDELYKTIDDCKQTIADLQENVKYLEDTKVALHNEVVHGNTKIDEIMKDMENMRNRFTEENNKLMQDLDERNATIKTLQTQLQNEIEYKMSIQQELTLLQTSKMALLEDINGLNSELMRLRREIQDKDKTIEGLDLYVKEEKNKNDKLKGNCAKLNEQLKATTKEVTIKENHIKQVQSTLQNKTHYYEDEIRKYNESLQLEHNKLLAVIEEKGIVQNKLEYLAKEKRRLEDCVNEKTNEILQLRAECAKLTEIVNENKMEIALLEEKLNQETARRVETDKAFDTETSRLIARLNDTEKSMKELRLKSNKCIEDKELQIQTLNVELGKLQKAIASEREKILTLQNEKEALVNKLREEVEYRKNLEKEYQTKCVMMSDVTSQMNAEIEKLKDEGTNLLKTIRNKEEEISTLEEKVTFLDEELKREIQQRTQTIKILEKEKEQLQFVIEEDNSNHEVLLRDKDRIIEQLEEELKITAIHLEGIQKDFEDSTFAFEKYKVNVQEKSQAKDNHIKELESNIQDLKYAFDASANDMKIMEERMLRQIEGLLKDIEQCKCALADEKAIRDTLEIEKASLTEHKETLEKEKTSLTENKATLEKEKASLIEQKAALEKERSDLIEQKHALEKYNSALIELKNTTAEEKTALIEHKNLLEKEKTSLIEHQTTLEQKLNEVNEILKVLYIKKDSLERENAILTQQVMEEKSARAVSEEQAKILEVEKENVEQELVKEAYIKKQLEDDRECLMQQLVEEKSAKELAEQERQILRKAKEEFESKFSHDNDNYSKKIVTLLENRALLSKEVENERTAKQALEKQLERLKQESEDLKILKERFAEDNDKLREYNNCLISDVDKFKNKYEELTKEHERLVEEREHFEQLSKEMRAALDEIKRDKEHCDRLLEKARESNDQFAVDMKEKQGKLKELEQQIAKLREECEAKEELNTKTSTILSDGLEKLSEHIKKENLQNDVLENVMSNDFKNKKHNVLCEYLIEIAVSLASELSLSKKMEKVENTTLLEMRDLVKEKEASIRELQSEVMELQETVDQNKIELTKQIDANTALETKQRDMQKLQHENQSLQNELDDVKVQLEVKVHSLKEKLIDNENLTEKLKKTYECQIDNLNVMVNKLTNYLKDKTIELECVRKERDRLQLVVDENATAMKTLEEEIKTQKQNQEKLINDFENERLVLKNMVTVTESVMEDQKLGLNKLVNEYLKAKEALQEENRNLKVLLEDERRTADLKIQDKDSLFESVFKEMSELKCERDRMIADKEFAEKEVGMMKATVMLKESQIETLESQNRELEAVLQKCKKDIALIEESNNELKLKKDALQAKLIEKVETLSKDMGDQSEICNKLQEEFKQKVQENTELQSTISSLNDTIRELNDQINELVKEKAGFETQKQEITEKIAVLEANALRDSEELDKLRKVNVHFVKIIDENKIVITNLEQLIKHELEQNQQLRDDTSNDKINLTNKCFILQEYQTKAERQLDERQKEINAFQDEIKDLKLKLDSYEQEIEKKNEIIANIAQEKDVVIGTMSKELMDEQTERERCKKELEMKELEMERLKQRLEAVMKEVETVKALRRENDALVMAAGQVETFPIVSYEKLSTKFSSSGEREAHHNQVDNTSDYTHSSMESLKTISDLEKIIHDKNRTITTLQSDISYMKSLLAESENKLLDVTKELEVSKDNCHQLSTQLKKIVHQKNEEIADLKKQVSKMSVTENRASQIIKVSAKYQAIILKRIAEIKNNTVLKELTNFGNTNSDNSNELRRSLNAGTITMEDLENFLETTERHIRKCSEKQLALQKERDRLTEVNRINESEIINLKKFLTELSVSFKTFSNIKELYAQKLSRVVSIQRTVRREILSLDGQITDATMCKLERGYAAVMQDLSECCMNMERWVERCLGRTISPEKIKQAFSSDTERASLASATFQNTSLEVQLGELENSFQKLLEEVMRAQKGEGAKDAQAVTVMEVRAEYEDKLSRMKAKMKQLYHEQIAVFQEKQKQEIAALEKELQATRDKLADSSKAYEEHIRALTMELWHVGQKFLVKKDEADWLRRKQRSGSLMSLQHVHSSGLVPAPEEPARPSDSHSLRSLPVTNNANTNTNTKREGRGLHMSDEEGEVFDNRWLKELSSTPRRPPSPRDSGMRLSELRWRNSLCPPHLKSSYPAETQFAPVVDEEDIKCASSSARAQRKEVGITAYKKPGPPTPSKQAGRLSATDSELRESLRVESDPQPSRKTSTPSRIRALFKRHDTTDGTPRTKRLSIFRKK